MKVTLVAVTKPVDPKFGKTLEEFVAYAARVSNPENQNNHGTGGKLIEYLIKNSHWSPLEMAHAVIEVETTRDIARQMLRHRSFAFQEFSQRYSSAFNFQTDREARLQDKKNRQNSIETQDSELADWFENMQLSMAMSAETAYKAAIDRGIAKEQARAFLPEGLTTSRLYMAGSIRSWWHYIDLRAANGTQKEHQEIAIACAKVLAPEFPMMRKILPNLELTSVA